MLYITTRNHVDTYTAARALQEDTAPDGGLYLPYRLPQLTADEIAALKDKTFGQCVAEFLNLFFFCRVTAWDVEVSAGRNPIKLQKLKNKTVVAEMWNNPGLDYTNLEKALLSVIMRQTPDVRISSWTRIAIRISVLFGLYSQLLQCGILAEGKRFDIAVATGDFSAAIAVWYARSMGLPVEYILCGCNDNGAVWDLLHLGQMRTDSAVVKTAAPLADISVPQELERLICAVCGQNEAARYAKVCASGGIFVPPAEMLSKLRSGMFAAVVSSDRLKALIPNQFSTSGYIFGPYTALAYGVLWDYRAKIGGGRVALLLGDRSPLRDVENVAAYMGKSQKAVKDILGVI